MAAHFMARHRADAAEELSWNVAGQLLSGAVAVRDSKDQGGPVVSVTPETWRAFTNWVKAGAFDLA